MHTFKPQSDMFYSFCCNFFQPLGKHKILIFSFTTVEIIVKFNLFSETPVTNIFCSGIQILSVSGQKPKKNYKNMNLLHSNMIRYIFYHVMSVAYSKWYSGRSVFYIKYFNYIIYAFVCLWQLFLILSYITYIRCNFIEFVEYYFVCTFSESNESNLWLILCVYCYNACLVCYN